MTATTPPHDVERTLAAFAAAVRDSPHNLLSSRALTELESRHIAESRAFAALLPRDARVLDLGTGGGFPGMVVAIARPDLDVTLLDATLKKVNFLREVADDLGVAVQCLRGRAEDLQQEYAGQFDVVTARAVAPLDRLLPWALPFLRPGGLLFAIKGAQWREELDEALPQIRHSRATVVHVPGKPPAVVTPDLGFDDEAMPRVVMLRAAG